MKFKELYPMFGEDTNICVYDATDTCINDNYSFPPKWIDDLVVSKIEILDRDSVRVELDYCFNQIALDNIVDLVHDYERKINSCNTTDEVKAEIINALRMVSDVSADTARALDADKAWDCYLD